MVSDFEEEDKKEFQKAAEAIPVPYRAFNKVETQKMATTLSLVPSQKVKI